MKGLLLDKDGDIRIVPHKGKDGLTGFVIGDTLIQNAAIVLELNQGELKEDPDGRTEESDARARSGHLPPPRHY